MNQTDQGPEGNEEVCSTTEVQYAGAVCSGRAHITETLTERKPKQVIIRLKINLYVKRSYSCL